jgi:hypothetical protein
VRDNATISHRGARYEIGRGTGFYGIWAIGTPQAPPVQSWPETPEGWYGAWSWFTGIEGTDRIVPVQQPVVAVSAAGPHAVAATVLLAAGIACGVAGLFPHYLNGASLSGQSAELVPHAMYLAVWTASALLIFSGGARLRAGGLLGIGLSVVTFGLFFTDAGTPIAGGAHLMGAGLVLSLIGWVACATGSWLALGVHSFMTPPHPRGYKRGTRIVLTLATLGTAVTFAPAWDTFTLHTAAGASQSFTAGNAFSNPAAVIAGNVAVMVAFVGIVVVATLWRPLLTGSALLLGAIIPMAAQAVSALVQRSETTSPTLFGISPDQATRVGLTINSGLTWTFWIYCALVVTLLVAWARTLIPPRLAQSGAAPSSLAYSLQ